MRSSNGGAPGSTPAADAAAESAWPAHGETTMERKSMARKSGNSLSRLAALLVGLGGLLVPRGASAFDWTLGNTKINLGGYVKLDVIYSRFSDGPVPQTIVRDFYVPSGTPIFATGVAPHSYLDFSAKETRLWFGTNTDFGEHKLGSYIEIDFISGQIPQTVLTSPTVSATTGTKIATNAYNPALRRAYITFDDQWLFGQDWSTFQNANVFPDTMEFIGNEDGTIFVRQPQVRYTYGPVQVAIETPETTVYPFRGVAFTKTDDNLIPDVVARYNLKTIFGDFAIAGLLRQLRDTNTVGGADSNSVGWGGSISGKVLLLGVPLLGKDDVRFMFTGGRGIGRYLALGSTLGDALVNSSFGLQSVWVVNGYVGYRHVWTQQWRSNLILSGISGFAIGDFLGSTATRRTGSAAVNLLYSPVSPLTLGGEFRVAGREDLAGNAGSLIRFQMGARYYF
jgi:hypothetical protein